MTEFRSIGVSRLRMLTDGEGVTTLVAGYGCPLHCRYCLNPACHGNRYFRYTVESLYEKVRPDSLYFEATGGGITFGGGEPLLQSDFIAEFIDYVRAKGHAWNFYIESGLAVPYENVAAVADKIAGWIIDIKDGNDRIYEAYTGKPSRQMRENLTKLASLYADRIRVRIPLIPNYNTESDRDSSEQWILSQSIKNVEKFGYIIVKNNY